MSSSTERNECTPIRLDELMTFPIFFPRGKIVDPKVFDAVTRGITKEIGNLRSQSQAYGIALGELNGVVDRHTRSLETQCVKTTDLEAMSHRIDNLSDHSVKRREFDNLVELMWHLQENFSRLQDELVSVRSRLKSAEDVLEAHGIALSS
mgnify:CR=1 FL=1